MFGFDNFRIKADSINSLRFFFYTTTCTRQAAKSVHATPSIIIFPRLSTGSPTGPACKSNSGHVVLCERVHVRHTHVKAVLT